MWRTKSEFARRAGFIDMMVVRAEELISDEELSSEHRIPEGLVLRSIEELYCYGTLKRHSQERTIL